MRLTPVLALLGVAACGDGVVTLAGSNVHSKVLAALSQVRQPDPESMFPLGVGYENGNERLRAAAFVLLKGMTRTEAISALAADGFACAGAMCRTVVSERETWAAQSFGIRPAGPLRVFTLTYQVEIRGASVRSMDDLEAKVSLKTKEWNGND